MSAVTVLIGRAQRGDPNAASEILPLVYNELRKLATARMAQEAANHTLQPTALVHEAWRRITEDDPDTRFANRAHFFAAAAEAMRRILVDRARAKSAGKRGGGWQRINLDTVEIAADANEETLLLVNESLDKLAKEEPRAAEVVKLRFYGGLTLEEVGQLLGFTERTAKRHWAFARAWLYQEMRAALNS